MREIKFRAWNNIDKSYIDWMTLCGMPRLITSIARGKEKHYQLEQYTELKDRNGVEIYEGDIIHAFGVNLEIKWIVDGWFADCEMTGICESGQEWDDNCKVIGNTHQNQELLEN